MVQCPRCQSMVDARTRTTCPRCPRLSTSSQSKTSMCAIAIILLSASRIPARSDYLVSGERKYRGIARALDRSREHTLVRRARPRDSSRKYLPTLGDVPAEQPSVLIVYVVHSVGAEPAGLSSPDEPSSTLPALPWPSVVASSLVSLFAAHYSSSPSSPSSSSPIGSTGSARRAPRLEPAPAATRAARRARNFSARFRSSSMRIVM